MPIKHKNCDNGYIRIGDMCKEDDCELCDWNNCPICNGIGQRKNNYGSWIVCQCQRKMRHKFYESEPGVPDTIAERDGER